MVRWDGWRWMLPVGRPESSCLLEAVAVAVVVTETMIGDREDDSDLGRIIWPTEPRQGRIFARSRMVARRGGTMRMTRTTMTSNDTDSMSGPARYGVGVRALILPLPLPRPHAARAMRKNHPRIPAGDAARANREAVAEARRPLLHRRLRHLLHRPVAAAAVKKVGAEGVVDAAVGAQEGAGGGEIGEAVAGAGRPPVVQAQVAAAVPVPRLPPPRRRGLDPGVAKSVVGVTAPRESPRRSRWIIRQVRIGARRRRSRKQMMNMARPPLCPHLLPLRQLLHTTRKT